MRLLPRQAAWLEELCSMRGRISRRSLLYRIGALMAVACLLVVLVFYATQQHRANPPTASVWIAVAELLLPLGLGVLISGIARRLQDIGLATGFSG